jgi:hypothetical protein
MAKRVIVLYDQGGGAAMKLRTAAGIALLLFGLSLALPALQSPSIIGRISGWEAAVSSGEISLGVLTTPSNLKGLVLGGAAVADQLTVGACLSGTAANMLLLLAIGLALCRRSTAALIAAAAALSSAGMCFLILISDQALQPLSGIGLWIGSMLWLSAIAAWSVWRIEFAGGQFAASISEERIPA